MQRHSRLDVPGPMRRALPKATNGRPIVICLDLNLPTAQERSFEEWTNVLHERVLAEHRTEATGEPDPFTAVFFTNYSWHWDGQNPAGNPIQIATLSHSAQAPCHATRSICSPKRLPVRGRPLRHAVRGARPPPSTRLLLLPFLSARDHEVLLSRDLDSPPIRSVTPGLDEQRPRRTDLL
jgi:hypothetical protein